MNTVVNSVDPVQLVSLLYIFQITYVGTKIKILKKLAHSEEYIFKDRSNIGQFL